MRRTFVEQTKTIRVIRALCPELESIDKTYATSTDKLLSTRIALCSSFKNINIEAGHKGVLDGKSQDMINFLALYWCFYFSNNKKIYKIAEEFGKELLKVEPKIDEKYLFNTPDPILIEFPDSVEFKCTGYTDIYYKSALITMAELDKVSDKIVSEEKHKIVRKLIIMLPSYKKDGTIEEPCIPEIFVIEFTKNCNIKEKLYQALADLGQEDSALFSYIINSMIYINSGNPDLREYKAPRKPENFKKRERQWIRKTKNKVMVDMTLLGFSYKKATIFGMEKTTVSGHFRWQPYDVGLAKVKLIWIESYEKNFKNFKDTDFLEVNTL